MPTGIAATQNATRNAVCLKVTGIADCAAYRIALKLRRAEEKLIPQSTRAASFKRLLGGILAAPKGHHESGQQKGSDPTESKLAPHDNQRPKR